MVKKKKLVVLTGAGISAESGLKTFRDADGLWEGHDVMEVATPEGWHKNPKLVIDFYNGTAVIQAHQIGMHRHITEITEALKKVYGSTLKGVYDKSAETLPKNLNIQSNEWIWGKAETDLVKEYGATYRIDWEKGQKTGFFVDQRENRKLVSTYSKGKKVLNTFCYTGGFSVAALAGGAKEVVSADISQTAIDLANNNVSLMKLQANQIHEGQVMDVMKHLGEDQKLYDIVVLDPPAFAKSLSKKHKAVMGYKRLNAMGLKRVSPGGLLFTFSCSQVVDDVLFANTITAAGIEAGRNCRILYRLGQGADHPVNLYHPEGHYLKGLVIQVE